MSFYTLEQIVALARKGSLFYKELYADVPECITSITDLPLATHERVMEIVHDASSVAKMFSSSGEYGIFYQSSATTGEPKSTLFGRDEWRATNKLIAFHHWRNNVLMANDVVCNLSAAGSASFMAVHGVIAELPIPCSEVPLGCDHSYEYIHNVCTQFRVNVLSGVNSTHLGFANYILDKLGSLPQIERILGGGELLYGVQTEIIQKAFPNADFIPFLYGTTEAGAIGYSEIGFAQNEFRVFGGACILEIIDIATGKIIDKPGLIGAAVVTSLLRSAVPAIRLDTGDYATWLEDEVSFVDRKFSIHGRRYPRRYMVDGIDFNEMDIQAVIESLGQLIRLAKIQIVLKNKFNQDQVELIVATDDFQVNSTDIVNAVHKALIMSNNPISNLIAHANSEIRVVKLSDFSESSKRKAKLILDMRPVGKI